MVVAVLGVGVMDRGFGSLGGPSAKAAAPPFSFDPSPSPSVVSDESLEDDSFWGPLVVSAVTPPDGSFWAVSPKDGSAWGPLVVSAVAPLVAELEGRAFTM